MKRTLNLMPSLEHIKHEQIKGYLINHLPNHWHELKVPHQEYIETFCMLGITKSDKAAKEYQMQNAVCVAQSKDSGFDVAHPIESKPEA